MPERILQEKTGQKTGQNPILQNQIVQVCVDRSLDLQVCSMKHPGSNRKWLPRKKRHIRQSFPAVQKILGDHPVNTTVSDLHHNIISTKPHILVEKPVQLDLFEENFLDVKSRESYQILGQIFDTYWLIAFKDKLFIMDQHAAHEKVRYERLLKELKNKTVASQQISPPVVLHLDSKEEQALLSYRDYFTSLGFEIEEFGGGSVASAVCRWIYMAVRKWNSSVRYWMNCVRIP